MFHERSRPVGRLFYLLAFVVAGLGVSCGQAGSHHYDQRCGVPCGRKSRGGNAADLLARHSRPPAVGRGGTKERGSCLGRSF